MDQSGCGDGRAARRLRNIDAVLDVVLEMFAEESLFPTLEQVATRSGLSLRSLYRYFEEPAELFDAAVERGSHQAREASRLHAIGRGPLDRRIDDFVKMRVDLYREFGARYRATVANAARHDRVRDQLARRRDDMRQQFLLQFAPELAANGSTSPSVAAASGDLVTQLDSIDYMRRHRGLTFAEISETLTATLRVLLT